MELAGERLGRVEEGPRRGADVDRGRERERMREAEPVRRLEASVATLLANRGDRRRELAGAIERSGRARRIGRTDDRREGVGIRVDLGVLLGALAGAGRARRGDALRLGDVARVEARVERMESVGIGEREVEADPRLEQLVDPAEEAVAQRHVEDRGLELLEALVARHRRRVTDAVERVERASALARLGGAGGEPAAELLEPTRRTTHVAIEGDEVDLFAGHQPCTVARKSRSASVWTIVPSASARSVRRPWTIESTSRSSTSRFAAPCQCVRRASRARSTYMR